MVPHFPDFSKAVQRRWAEMSQRELFVTTPASLPGPDQSVPTSFDRYLAAFPEGTNPLYRKRTTYDCQCCKQFVRRLGTLVNLVNGEFVTMWDHLDVPEPFKTVADEMSRILMSASPAEMRMIINELIKIDRMQASADQKARLVQALLTKVLTSQSVAATSASG